MVRANVPLHRKFLHFNFSLFPCVVIDTYNPPNVFNTGMDHGSCFGTWLRAETFVYTLLVRGTGAQVLLETEYWFYLSAHLKTGVLWLDPFKGAE